MRNIGDYLWTARTWAIRKLAGRNAVAMNFTSSPDVFMSIPCEHRALVRRVVVKDYEGCVKLEVN